MHNLPLTSSMLQFLVCFLLCLFFSKNHRLQQRNTCRWYTSEILSSFMHAEGVVSSIFSPGQHIEVISRSGQLLQWLARVHFLTIEDLKIIWKAAGDGCSVDTRLAILKTMSQCRYNFVEKHLLFLAGAFNAEATMRKEVDSIVPGSPRRNANHGNGGQARWEQVVDALVQIFRYGYSSSSAATENFANILWQGMQDDADSTAFQGLLKLLCETNFARELRVTYSLKCVEALEKIGEDVHAEMRPRQADAAPMILNLLHELIKSYRISEYSLNFMNRKQLLELLSSKDHRLTTIILKLVPVDASHALRLISFIMPTLPAEDKIGPKELQDILKTCKAAKNGETMDNVCSWLEGLKDHILDHLACAAIFGEISPQDRGTEIETFSLSRFKCFQTFFKRVNVTEGKAEKLKSDKIFLFSPNLVGFEDLVHLALCAPRKDVSESATQFLRELCTYANWDTPMRSSGVLWEKLIQCCMSHLATRGVTDSVAVKRGVQILCVVLDESEVRGLRNLRAHSEGARGMPVRFHVKFMNENDNHETTFKLRAYANDTLWSLKESICAKIGQVTPECIVLQPEVVRSAQPYVESVYNNRKTLVQNHFHRRNIIIAKILHRGRVGPEKVTLLINVSQSQAIPSAPSIFFSSFPVFDCTLSILC